MKKTITIPKPTIGRIVMYRKYRRYEGPEAPRAAIIIDTSSDFSEPETVNLLVFNRFPDAKKTELVEGVDYAPPGAETYHDVWYYPERSEETIEIEVLE